MKLVIVFDVDARNDDEVDLSQAQRNAVDIIQLLSDKKMSFREYFTTSDETYDQMLEV